MMKQPNRRKDISIQRREQILNAAADLFSKSGYHGVSVDAIAKKAGISKGNLYWHFKSKQEIFHKLFEHLAEPMFTRLFQILESNIEPRAKLQSLTRTCIEMAEENPEIVRFGWQIAAQPELKEMFTSEYTEWMQPFIVKLTPIFAETGEKRAEDVARFYALSLDAFMGMAAMMPEVLEKENILEILTERFIDYNEGKNE